MTLRWLGVGLAAIVFFAACGANDDVASECPTGSTCGPPSLTAAASSDPGECAPSVDPEGSFVPSVTFNPGTSNATLLYVEVADEPPERSLGLSERACLAPDWGMIFVYQEDSNATFGMSRMLFPLSIAWVSSDGTIVEIEDMDPPTTGHASAEPYRYAIEVNQGWFAEHGIEAGDQVNVGTAFER